MENLKIRVENSSESKEAQELFFELDYNWLKKGYVEVKTPETIMSFENGALTTGIRGSISHKEITLPELRDMVVLKRNDVGDATHKDPNEKESLYFRLFGEWWNLFTGGKWQQFCHIENPRSAKLKPIEKTEMKSKEYLNKETHAYVKTHNLVSKDSNWIEIPEGAYSFRENLKFYNEDGSKFYDSSNCWAKSTIDRLAVLWQRYTLPEELPFIDDEPSLNDQYAGIEKVRQTLNQRQSQYGSFEDVAMITEQMVDIMRKGYYENLAYNQKMALYMICSKMARIVNGNPNHKDSWHDIAGYATLIDNELVSEKDMPF